MNPFDPGYSKAVADYLVYLLQQNPGDAANILHVQLERLLFEGMPPEKREMYRRDYEARNGQLTVSG